MFVALILSRIVSICHASTARLRSPWLLMIMNEPQRTKDQNHIIASFGDDDDVNGRKVEN